MDMPSFLLPANGKATPKSLDRRRKMAESLMASGMDTSPIASPWQGFARMAQALAGGLATRKADQQEAEGQQSARDAMTKALMGGDKGAMLDALNNPFMDSTSLDLVGDAWKRSNAPPPPPELKDMGNGQFYQYDPANPQGGQVFTPEGYQAPPGSRLITGAEAVQMGLPEGAYNLSPDGKISAIGGNGTNVNINNAPPGQPMIGTIPQGFAAVADPSQPSGFRMERISGGPEDQTKVNEAKANKKMILSDVVSTAADKARELISNKSTGLIGQGMSLAGQTDAAEIYRQVNTLKANATIERLQAMRAESPTGGALGSVTQQENAMLADAAGALDPSAGTERFSQALDNYELTLDRIVHGYEAGTQIFMEKKAKNKSDPGAAGVPEGVDPVEWQHMTPEERALWQ